LFVGALGTLIGAGGGFILVPVLLILFPDMKPETITATSLAVVFANATSGSFAYSRTGKIDYRSGFLFALAGVPGVFIGILLVRHVSRATFDPAFGVLLLALGIYLVTRKMKAGHTFNGFRPTMERTIAGETFRFNLWLALVISFFVGIASSFFGIGGGIIHVPALVFLLNFPVMIATATSHFILAMMSLIATSEHAWHGSLAPGLHLVAWLAPGVIVGAQIGGRLAHRIHGNLIIRILGAALALASIRFLWPH
jgi:uncharacterized membrane protein YfcA